MDCTLSQPEQTVTTFRCLNVGSRIGKVLGVLENLGPVSMRPWNGEQYPDVVPFVVTLTHTQKVADIVAKLKQEVGDDLNVEIEPNRPS